MKNIRLFLQFCIFVLVVCAAILMVPHLGQNLDQPFEAGYLSAPDIPRDHGAANGEGHGEEHGDVQEGHGDGHGDAATTDAHAEAEKKTRLT